MEIALAMKYRKKNEKGEWVARSFSYVKELFGGKKLGKAIAVFCAFFTMIAGIPSIATQTLSATAQVAVFGINGTVFGIIVAAIVAVIIFGGIKRIAKVMEKAVPIMATVYILGVLVILALNADNILPSIGSIFVYAFTPHAAVGGFAGSTVALALSGEPPAAFILTRRDLVLLLRLTLRLRWITLSDRPSGACSK